MDSQTKTLEVQEPAKKFSSIGSGNMINGLAKPFERSTTPVQGHVNLSTYYAPPAYSSNPYYYEGYDGSLNEWNDYRYMSHDLLPMQHGLNQISLTSGIGQGTGFTGRSHNHMYGHLGNTYRPGSGFGLNYYNPKTSLNSWQTVAGKYTPRGHSYGNENKDRLFELSKGPRVKGQLALESGKLAVKEQDLSVSQRKGEEKFYHSEWAKYNREDFPENYSDAKFFVIKSYSEDDVHKSIKYNVWASTPSGNKKLDAAYQEAQGKPGPCPVFLLFSVNSSGQFVGLAEMAGSVDFNKTLDFWQQDKWTGSFPVKWHIIKDVPNNLLKHIKLEYNDNKPVTNSRDTQEVKLDQGMEVLKIFKLHSSNSSILDDFEFYELRQKTMQEKKAKRQQFQKQFKVSNDGEDEKLLKSFDALTVAPAVVPASNGELKLASGLATNTAKAAGTEKSEIPNGAAAAH